jgi:hypothetical protein
LDFDILDFDILDFNILDIFDIFGLEHYDAAPATLLIRVEMDFMSWDICHETKEE